MNMLIEYKKTVSDFVLKMRTTTLQNFGNDSQIANRETLLGALV